MAAPLIADGLILRRAKVMALAEKLQTDRSAVELLRLLNARYGSAPLRLRTPGRTVALMPSRSDVSRVFGDSPKPFAAATREKIGSLRHFQPHTF